MKVLLVTQAHSDLAKISRVITRLGGTVSPARLGYEGLERFESEHPDIILIDSQLPDIDGCVVAQKIRAKETANHWTPIIHRSRKCRKRVLKKPFFPAQAISLQAG